MFPKKVILMCYCLVIVLHYLLVADNLAYAYYSGIRSDFQVPKTLPQPTLPHNSCDTFLAAL